MSLSRLVGACLVLVWSVVTLLFPAAAVAAETPLWNSMVRDARDRDTARLYTGTCVYDRASR